MTKLASAIKAAIAAQPRGASTTTILAAISTVIDGSGQPSDVIVAALQQVINGGGLSAAARAALSQALAKYGDGGTGGTGGTGGNGNGTTTGLGAGPALTSGGGATDYSNGQ
ncbi:MAG: hypothetical protein QM690_11750 [Sphingobium sp.]